MTPTLRQNIDYMPTLAFWIRRGRDSGLFFEEDEEDDDTDIRDFQLGVLDHLEKSKVAYHEHDGFLEHPVRVKDHIRWFSEKRFSDKPAKGVTSLAAELEREMSSKIRVGGQGLDPKRIYSVLSELPSHLRSLVETSSERANASPLRILPARGKAGAFYIKHDYAIKINPDLFQMPLREYPGITGATFGDVALLHEIGHVLYDRLRDVKHPLMDAWHDAARFYGEWKKAKKPLITKYSETYYDEFFSECFVYFLRAPELLKQVHPTIYEAFATHISTPIKKERKEVEFVPGLGAFMFETEEGLDQLGLEGEDATLSMLEKARVAYHEHDGWQEHPVAVKHHEEYFSQQPARVLSSSLTRFLATPRLVNIVQVLGEEGGRPYLVGGSVRDALLGIPVKDFDIEVHGISGEKLGTVLQEKLGAKGEQVGKQFGVWKLGDIDISVPRKETKTGPKHTDFVVTQTPDATPEEAARRRDFTVNALMYDPMRGQLLDFFGGVKDLKAGILRHVDDKTFVEDPLRVYRAAQFAARFNFDIAESTKQLAARMDLSSLPTERVYDEFRKMLLRANKPSIGIKALDDMGVLRQYYPELYALKTVPQSPDYHAEGDVFNHTLLALDKAAKISLRFKSLNNRLSIMLATLLHDLGKQNTTEVHEDGSVTQYKHEITGVPYSKEFLSKLTTESEVVDDVLFLVEHHLTPARFYASQAPAVAFRRLINKWGLRRLGLLAAVSEADITGRRQKTETGELIEPTGIAIDWFRKQVAKVVSQSGVTASNYLKPLITGDALIARGFEEGKLVGDILRDVRERQETGELTSSQDALTYVDATYHPITGQDKKVQKADIPISAKAIITNKDGKVLCLKARGTKFWDLPGGHIDSEETPIEGLIREIKEETGLTVDDVEELDLSGDVKIGSDNHPVLFYHVVASGTLKVNPEEHTKYVWMDEDNLDDFNLGAFKNVVKDEVQSNDFLEKAIKPGYHDHEGTIQEHPVAVKDHQAYFSSHTSLGALSHNVRYVAMEQADNYLREYFPKPTVENAKVGEVVARISYIAQGAAKINPYLRGKQTGKVPAWVKKAIRGLDSYISRTKVPENLAVFKGVSGISKFKKGNDFYDLGYFSVSLDPFIAESFRYEGQDPWVSAGKEKLDSGLVEVILPLGANVGLGNIKERELILPRNARFKVLDISAKRSQINKNKTIPYVRLALILASEESQEREEVVEGIQDYGMALQKARVAYHEHEGWQEHPVAVKDHQEYFSKVSQGTVQPLLGPKEINVHYLASAIKRAVQQMPSRFTHGFTGKNAFWITADGVIHPWDKFDRSVKAIMGHSHVPDNWAHLKPAQKRELKQPHNAGDIKVLQNGVRRGYSDLSVLITGENTFEVLYVPDNAKAKFAALSVKQLHQSELKYDEIHQLIEQGVVKTTLEADVLTLRAFAEKHGLVYIEDIPWTDMIQKTDISLKKDGSGILEVGPAKFFVEYATSPLELQQGLSDRPTLESNHGMLFVFPTTAPQIFHTRDMQFPIDIIGIGENGAVRFVEKNVEPNVLKIPIPPCKYVLEINAGEAKGIGTGSVVEGIQDYGEVLQKARVAYHEHEGWQEHPVAVKDHQDYFGSFAVEAITSPSYQKQIADIKQASKTILAKHNISALKHYKGYLSSAINHYLRTGQVRTGENQSVIEPLIAMIDEAFDKMPPLTQPIVVYRGILKDYLGRYKKPFIFDSYMSTSLSREAAQAHGGFAIPVLIPPGTKVLWLDFIEEAVGYSTEEQKYLREDEILLPRGTKFHVVEGDKGRVELIVGKADDGGSPELQKADIPLKKNGSSILEVGGEDATPPVLDGESVDLPLSALGKFNVLLKQAEFGRPPRPGLVPQTGDPYHPGRWVRPEDAEAAAGKPRKDFPPVKVPPHPKKDAFPFRLTEEEINRIFADLLGYRSQEVREDYRNVKTILGDNLIVEEQPNLPVNHEVFSVHIEHINKIPSKFLVLVKDAGVTISLSGQGATTMDKMQYLSNLPLEGFPPGYTFGNAVAGLYDPQTKRVIVGGTLAGPSVATHEIFHAVDHILGWNKKNVFRQAYTRLQTKLSPYEAGDIKEFVAESTAMFFSYGKADVAWTYDIQFADDLERALSEVQ